MTPKLWPQKQDSNPEPDSLILFTATYPLDHIEIYYNKIESPI